jgi:site-specific DNA-methyltransferase (adenine-specific)
MSIFTLYLGDCLDILPTLPDGCVDMILCDLPYGTTACKWDTLVDLEKLWIQYGRLIKKKGAIVLNSAQPFTAKLIVSKIEWFRHEWIWDKVRPSGMQIAKYRPMQRHESICVFGRESVNYYPIMVLRDEKVTGRVASHSDSSPLAYSDGEAREYLYKFPQSILDDDIGCAAGIIDFCKPTRAMHPTQKPVPLLSYLLQTYSKIGDVVLDNTMGSGSTGVACVNEARNFIGIEKNEDIFTVAKKRIEDAVPAHYIFGVNADDSTVGTIKSTDERQPSFF